MITPGVLPRSDANADGRRAEAAAAEDVVGIGDAL